MKGKKRLKTSADFTNVTEADVQKVPEEFPEGAFGAPEPRAERNSDESFKSTKSK